MYLKPLLHPEMKPDESLEGYLQRLIFINHRSFDAVSRYKQKLGNGKYQNDNMLYRRFVEGWRCTGMMLKRMTSNIGAIKVLAFTIVNRKHKTLLLQNCSKCLCVDLST